MEPTELVEFKRVLQIADYALKLVIDEHGKFPYRNDKKFIKNMKIKYGEVI